MDISVPVGNAHFFWDSYSPKKFALDCVPLSALRNANKDVWMYNKEYGGCIEYFSPKGKLIVTSYRLKGAQYWYENFYLYLPGVHHIVWSDTNIIDTPSTVYFAKGRMRRIEFKAFVAVSDTVNVGISVYDHFYGSRTFIVKRVSPNSWDSVLTAVGLPDPIPERKPRFIITEDRYKELLYLHINMDKELKKSLNHISHNIWRKYDRLINQWFHDIISSKIGFYNPDDYEINWKAVGCHPDIARHLQAMVWGRKDHISGINRSTERKNYKGKIRVDLNRVLIKKNIKEGV